MCSLGGVTESDLVSFFRFGRWQTGTRKKQSPSWNAKSTLCQIDLIKTTSIKSKRTNSKRNKKSNTMNYQSVLIIGSTGRTGVHIMQVKPVFTCSSTVAPLIN
jgi:hypothetical protein